MKKSEPPARQHSIRIIVFTPVTRDTAIKVGRDSISETITS